VIDVRDASAFLMTKIDGRTKQGAARQIDESLKRLQIHELIHTQVAERVFAPGGAVEALLEAKQAGTAEKHGFTFDAVQLCLNVMDAHVPEGFEKLVVPRLLKQNIGILAMKSLGGALILESKTVSATQCIQYVMSLPVSSVITGCDSMRALRQSIAAAQGFRPWSPTQRDAVLARTEQAAQAKRYEQYKTTDRFDDTDRNPDWVS
jgi:aryl-alcohol dehydrogenase-like predicted oxidoreductase